MKSKTLSLIAAAFALTLTATPFVAQAQQTSSSDQPGQELSEKGSWKNLGLTDAQKAEMQKIRRNSLTQMYKILTPEQKEQLKATMQERRNQGSQGEGKGKWKKDGFASLNLTEAQKNQMRSIKESSKQQIKAILTPAQRQKLQQMQQNVKSRRQQGNNN
ncbi:Spy/CpxP family protein refolding chaperone [Sphaerospermopsis aphanizomenoides BCCUSP55]|uniref:Spy/CpxP family protein refolding chaperone n=1 Tax=Sphaerospermopsis aphanizomenoides TaxID=459663 RepID=UPI000B2C87E7|nr:Spy/CpxP family protein refolding chaperone [Sphaerospermopsis aphanizomenoides]MBK1988648.1 Spy/CpxP family protein refolding chaperone [Sphaerospermopsis aphanizomenoides BCCUSP55]